MYALSPQHLDLQKHIRSLVDTFIEPQAAEIDRTGEYPYDIIRILAREGIMALPIPREYGGDYRDLLSWFIVMEEVGKACGTTANILASHSLCAYVIEINGSEESCVRRVDWSHGNDRAPSRDRCGFVGGIRCSR